MDLLRIAISGSVDDGKSTLMGRLLYDSKLIFEDQLEELKKISKRKNNKEIDLSLLTDGLKSEREQGITIDVAYRYFSTSKRKFIVADTPGHIQYTRNMFTGASNADIGVLLIDAKRGMLEQTKRHTFILSLLGIKNIIICINKMDLVNYEEEIYQNIKKNYIKFSSRLSIANISFIPVSALKGDNIVEPSLKMNWYKGSTLLYALENCTIGSNYNFIDSRFPIQHISGFIEKDHKKYRVSSGRIEGGVFKPKDKICILPSGVETTIKNIFNYKEQIKEAFYPMSVSMIFEDDVDISRGDMIAKINNKPTPTRNLNLLICWMSNTILDANKKYIIKHTTNEVVGKVDKIYHKIDINTLHKKAEEIVKIGLNDIARVSLKVSKPLWVDTYKKNRATGSLIIIDFFSKDVVAAGIIL